MTSRWLATFILIAILSGLLLAACAPAPAPPTATPVPPTDHPTSEPTATPEPTETPTPLPPVTATLLMDVSTHQGPGNAYATINHFNRGDEVTIVGRYVNAQREPWYLLADGSWVKNSGGMVLSGFDKNKIPVVYTCPQKLYQ